MPETESAANFEHYRLIFRRDENPISLQPRYPILVGMEGIVYEASSARGAVAVLVEAEGEDYLDVEAAETEWYLRVKVARSHAVVASLEGRDAIVWDSRRGRIKENYAAFEGDEDYEDDFSGEPQKIIVDTDKTLLQSLADLGTVNIYVREGYDYFTQEPQTQQNCKLCAYYNLGEEDVCPVYNRLLFSKVQLEDGVEYNPDAEGRYCTTFLKRKDQSFLISENGGEYINIANIGPGEE